MTCRRCVASPVVVRVVLDDDGRRAVHYFRDVLPALALAGRVERSGGRVLEVAAAYPDRWPSLADAPDVAPADWVPVGGGAR